MGIAVKGYPKSGATSHTYDEIDYQRACQAYLWAQPVVANSATAERMRKLWGTSNQVVPIFEQGANAKQVILTANSQSIYQFGTLDLADGPMVVELPANGLGGFDNGWQQPLCDIGPLGPDKGKGGKFLVLPPGNDARSPAGYFEIRSDTLWVLWLVRGSKVEGDAAPAVDLLRQTKVYPLARKDDPPPMRFLNGSKLAGDITFPLDFSYWEVLDRAIQREPVREQDKAMLGLLTGLGIEKGKRFRPDARAKRILARAQKAGLEMARTIAFDSRSPRAPVYKGRRWEWLFLADAASFVGPAYLDIDARVTYTYGAEFTSPAMMMKNVGVGSQYLATYKDARGRWLDGARHYRLRLEPDIPVKDWWSIMVYDALTRSMIDTRQGLSGLDSFAELAKGADGSVDLYFGPSLPKGAPKTNWVRTRPGRGFFLYFRAYGPLKPFFDQTWKLNDVAALVSR
jgi:hypothetical protein